MNGIKVAKIGTNVVRVSIDGVGPGWEIGFDRNVCNEFHADLEVAAIGKAVNDACNAAVAVALDRVQSALRDVPGKKKIRAKIDMVRGWYS